MTTLTALVQARMTSTRLPGKTLRPLLGRPLISYMLERLARTRNLAQVIVTTSTEPSDDPVAEFCSKTGVVCFRGPLQDVALRFKLAAETHALPAFVRLSADSPLIDPLVIDQAIALFTTGDWDLVTNIFPRSFPKGQSVEVIRTEAFQRAFPLMSEPMDHEHLTQVFYRQPTSFKIRNFALAGPSHAALNLSIDAPEDISRFERLLHGFGADWVKASLPQLIQAESQHHG